MSLARIICSSGCWINQAFMKSGYTSSVLIN